MLADSSANTWGGREPILLVLENALTHPSHSSSTLTGIIVLTLFSLGGLLFQLLLFLVSGRRVRLGLRTAVAFANLTCAGAALYLHYEIHWEQYGLPWETAPSAASSMSNPESHNNTNLLWAIGGAPWRRINDSAPTNLTVADATSGLCVNRHAHVLLAGASLSLEAASSRRLFVPGVEVLYYCFLSLKDVYIDLVRVMYIVLFLSLDFVPIMLFVYPLRHYESLEKAMGINLDKMTCYMLPIVSLFMLLFVVAIEFQLN